MGETILGLHHITAIAGNAQRNYDFYTKILGQRLVKKTVNFDDPGTYHFYYGDEVGTPGTILTFFPWERIRQGRNGAGMATEIGYSVPTDSLEFWNERFKSNQIIHEEPGEMFGEAILKFRDPDGLHLKLVIPESADDRKAWITGDLNHDVAIKGFHSVVLRLKSIKPTEKILTEIFGYQFLKNEGNLYRFTTEATTNANTIDLEEVHDEPLGLNSGGTIHHVAFRVRNENIQMEFRQKLVESGLYVTDKINRNYFYSIYFREPGGVLFELATENPGFIVDETVNQLGTRLTLPPQYENSRKQIEEALPILHQER